MREESLCRRDVRPRRGDQILDIGCGTAEILEHLPEIQYFGFDASQKYIDAAKARFGNRGTFSCDTVTTATLQRLAASDVVLAVGILHHLDDSDATSLLELAKAALKPGGRLVTLAAATWTDNLGLRDLSSAAIVARI